jgi:excinuclease UvrABC nuclease subunit
MTDMDWLLARGFVLVGSWSDQRSKLHAPSLERAPGIYAYVVGERIRYIGKGTRLRSRVRSYNRALATPTDRAFREVHHGILRAWQAGKKIDVWVYKLTGSDGSLLALETRLIAERRPTWNGGLGGGAVETDQR